MCFFFFFGAFRRVLYGALPTRFSVSIYDNSIFALKARVIFFSIMVISMSTWREILCVYLVCGDSILLGFFFFLMYSEVG